MNELFENVLSRLGFSARPEVSLAGLRAFYAAWCRRVPFDNVRKLIHVRSGDAGPLPGSTPEDFFYAWLRHGTGGTCWSGAGAMQALLTWLGFEAERGIATMLVVPDLPPNHGTVRVRCEGAWYLVDGSILHGEPLLLDEQAETAIAHATWGIRCIPRDGRLHIAWRPFHRLDGFECRLDWFGASAADYQQRYEQTRGWSPFNYEAVVRCNRVEEVLGAAFGKAMTLRADGGAEVVPIDHEGLQRLLLEVVGMSEEIVSQLPRDVPTPPPPGSRTAQLAEG